VTALTSAIPFAKPIADNNELFDETIAPANGWSRQNSTLITHDSIQLSLNV